MITQPILDTFAEAVVLLNDANRVQQYNKAALSFFEDSDSAIGANAAAVFADWLNIADLLHKDGSHNSYQVMAPDTAAWYEISIESLACEVGGENGRLLKITDISEQIALKEALTLAQKQAASALQIKSNFLDIMSHELRTPLNAVVGYVNMLRNSNLDSEQVGLIKSILNNSDKLSNIITSLLEYAEAEADHYELHHKPFNLKSLLDAVCTPFQPKLKEKTIAFSCQVDKTSPAFYLGDSLRIQQVLTYLLDNAVKYTEEGRIEITAVAKHQQADQYCLNITVQDSGIGVPQQQQDAIFQTFNQLDNSITRQFGGLGLSLAIAQKIAAHMGGTITVSSSEAEGSVFTFTALVKHSHIEPEQQQHENDLALKDKKILLVGKNTEYRRILSRDVKLAGMIPYVASTTTEALYWLKKDKFDMICLEDALHKKDINFCSEVKSSSAYKKTPIVLVTTETNSNLTNDCITALLQVPFETMSIYDVLIRAMRQAQTPSKKSKKSQTANIKMSEHHPLNILMVEDNLINQKVAEKILSRLGYKVDIATNGQIAYEMAQQNEYDVLLMDIQMPVMDGVEATKKIRHLENQIRQPQIIAVTAHARKGDRERYLAAGMNDYISKPIKIDKLVQSLYACQPKSKSTDELQQPVIPSGINEDTLKTLFGDDVETFLAEMGPAFLEDSRRLMQQIKLAVQFENQYHLKESAHALRGACASLGMDKLAQICRQLEHTSNFSDAAYLSQLISDLDAEHKQVVVLLGEALPV